MKGSAYTWENVAFVGDGLNDLEIIKKMWPILFS